MKYPERSGIFGNLSRNNSIAVSVSLLFAVMVSFPVQRRLWHDELFTYYIAHAPTLKALIYQTQSIDLNPPLIYLVTRLSERAFGDALIATRLPTMLAFLSGSLLLYAYLRRKVTPIWAAAVVLSFWCTKFFMYATEVRPYGLLFFFAVLAVFALDLARTRANRLLYLGCILFGVAGVNCCHVFGPFSVLPIFVSEAVRTLKRRKVDWAIWIMLLVPMFLTVMYLPLVRHGSTAIFPASLQAGYRKALTFYPKILNSLLVPVAVSGFAILLVRRRNQSGIAALRYRLASLPLEDAAMIAAFLAPPVLINLFAFRSHGSFFDRYCIMSAVAVCVVVVLLLGNAVRFQYLPGLVTSLVLAAMGLYNNTVKPLTKMVEGKSRNPGISEVMPQLPFVVASGLVFLELDHYENATFLKRVYYLTDHDGVMRYAHANFFEDFKRLKLEFPIRANVDKLTDFAQTHNHFLLLADTSAPESWLYFKLQAEGASIIDLGESSSPYSDTRLYEIRLPEKKLSSTRSPLDQSIVEESLRNYDSQFNTFKQTAGASSRPILFSTGYSIPPLALGELFPYSHDLPGEHAAYDNGNCLNKNRT